MREVNELIRIACQQIQSLDDFLQLGQACLLPILETTEFVSVSSSRYQYYSIPILPEESRFLRPINETLFVRNVAEFELYSNQFHSLIEELRDSQGDLDSLSPNIRQFANGNAVTKFLYTSIQSIGCILDISSDSQAARKNFGQRFEDFIKALLTGLGISNEAFTFSVKKPSINLRYNVPIDIIMNTQGVVHSSRSEIDPIDTFLSVKTSSKDRMNEVHTLI